MKIKFLGHGGAFATSEEGNSNAVVTINGKNLLIDFGVVSNYVWREEWGKSFNDIDAMCITHVHLDHCCLETFLFHRYFLPITDKQFQIVKPKLFAAPPVITELWEHLKPSMGLYRNEVLHLTNFVDCHACSSFDFERVNFKLVRNEHIKSSFGRKDAYGLFFILNGIKVYWSSDSANINIKYIEAADLVFHDCETLKQRSNVHAHYLSLRKLPGDLKKKMWLMHYGKNNLKPQSDGFAGFVVKNQEFQFD